MKLLKRALSCITFLSGVSAFGSVSVYLTAPASTIAVGQTLTITATAHDSAASVTRFSYQFTVRPHDVGPFIVMKDFYWTNTFAWTPGDREGDYDIGVTAWSLATKNSAPTYITVHVNPRVTGSTPVVSGTNNPLVALFSAPPCSAPAEMRVRFRPLSGGGAPNSIFTSFKPCTGSSMNFYIGGMLQNTTYMLQGFLYSQGAVTPGPALSFTTGSVPSSVKIPNHFRLSGPALPTSIAYPYLLHASDGSAPYATDLNENVVWYLTGTIPNDSGYMTHLLSGGTFLATQDDRSASAAVCPPNSGTGCGDHQFLREFDMAGNVIRETSWAILNDEINDLRAAQGKSQVKLDFISHEGIRLPNGYTATMVTDEQVKGSSSGVHDFLGDVIIVLDNNWQVAWAWDVFDFFDVNRMTLSSICTPAGPGCPPQFHNVQANGKAYTQANDYTHANSIFYDSTDGNLIISLRNQSWVVKADYNNGAGDGHVIWTLGYGGSFRLPAGYPVTDWFSGQHDPEIQSNGILTLFDNNNPSTLTNQPGGTAHGQAWQLDTVNKIATPIQNVDLGVVSPAVGSATLLSNGNYEWQAGFINGSSSKTFEFTPSGALVYEQESDALTYRSFRLRDLYTP